MFKTNLKTLYLYLNQAAKQLIQFVRINNTNLIYKRFYASTQIFFFIYQLYTIHFVLIVQHGRKDLVNIYQICLSSLIDVPSDALRSTSTQLTIRINIHIIVYRVTYHICGRCRGGTCAFVCLYVCFYVSIYCRPSVQPPSFRISVFRQI